MQQPYRAATGSPRGPGRHLIVTTAVLACLGSVLASAPAQASAGADDAGHAGSTGDDRVRASTPVELVPNGHFETGIEGWRVNDNTRQALDHVHPGQDSTGSVALTTSSPGKVILNDSVNTVRATTVGAVYEFSAWVRTLGAVTRHGLLRVREAADDVVVSSGRTRFAATTEWQQVTLAYTAASDASVLDLKLVAWRFKRGQSLQVDRVSMTTFEVDGRETCVSNAQGIPREGAYLGAAVSGASSLPVREDQYGTTLGLHRMFYTPAQIDKAINDATSDLANERMPWISFKLPNSWQDMADGRGDAWVHELTTRLAGIDGPVWVAFHHEPEGDGPMAQWVRMQQHLSTLVHADTDNVAMTVIYSGYPTYYGPTIYPLADKWPGSEYVDILGFDAYNFYNGTTNTKTTELSKYIDQFDAFADAHGVPIAVGETGYTHAESERNPDWLTRAYTDLVAAGGAGLSYFDSSYNSVSDWTISNQIKLDQMTSLLPLSERVC